MVRRRWPFIALGFAAIVAGWSLALIVSRQQVAASLLDRSWGAADRWATVYGWLTLDRADADFWRARVGRHRGRLAEAVAALQRAKTRGLDEARFRREAFMGRVQWGDLANLEGTFGELLSESGEDAPELCEAYAYGCMLQQRTRDAHAVFDVWEADYPLDPRPNLLRGRLLLQANQFHEAEAELRSALHKRPGLAAAEYQLGLSLLLQKHAEEARAVFERAAKSSELPYPSQVRIAECCRQLDRLAEADSWLKRAEQSVAHRAMEACSEVLEPIYPSEILVWNERADWYLAQQQFAAAVPILRRAVEQAPQLWDLRFKLVTALRRSGAQQEAEDEATTMQAIKEQDGKLATMIATARQEPTNADLRCEIGEIYLARGSLREASVWFQAALTSEPLHAAARRGLETLKAKSRERATSATTANLLKQP